MLVRSFLHLIVQSLEKFSGSGRWDIFTKVQLFRLSSMFRQGLSNIARLGCSLVVLNQVYGLENSAMISMQYPNKINSLNCKMMINGSNLIQTHNVHPIIGLNPVHVNLLTKTCTNRLHFIGLVLCLLWGLRIKIFALMKTFGLVPTCQTFSVFVLYVDVVKPFVIVDAFFFSIPTQINKIKKFYKNQET